MSTPSTLLLCAGAASSLAAVWTLAGFSESSTPRFSPRVIAAAALGLITELFVYGRAPGEVRRDLSLAMLFALASVAALVVGAAKIDGALAERDGPRVVRRSAGVVAGAFFGMAAIGAAALDLSGLSLAHARTAWTLMFGLTLGTFAVFAQRARYAGVGVAALGARVVVLGVIALALVLGARLTVAAPARRSVVAPAPSAEAPLASEVSVVAPAPLPSPPAPVSAAPPASAAAPSDAAAVVSAAASAGQAPPAGPPGELQIEAVTARGLLEADVRGGVTRRLDRLQACVADAKNGQSGTLTLKVGIDASGSVNYSRATAGDLMGTPLATCLLPVFYKMGFAAPASSNAGFDITLRASPQ